MDIEYFMKLQNASGIKNKREKQLVKVNKQMSKHFEDTFDTEDVLLNGEPFKLMIIKDTDGNTFKKKIKSPHDKKFNLGDYVEWNGQMWLITLLDSDEKTWNRGYMYLCTILLRWQNEKGEIVERYGFSEDFTKYTTGTSGNNTITLGDYQYGVTLPVDDETKFIKRDKRFPIDIDGVEPPDVYKLTNRKILLADDRAFGRGGILTWTLSFSEFNHEKDKLVELENGTQAWICDYIKPTTTLPSSDETTNLFGSISGNKTIKSNISSTYIATVYDSNGDNIDWDDKVHAWRVVSDFEVKTKINGNKITITVDENYIGNSFILRTVESRNDSIITEITINIIGLF